MRLLLIVLLLVSSSCATHSSPHSRPHKAPPADRRLAIRLVGAGLVGAGQARADTPVFVRQGHALELRAGADAGSPIHWYLIEPIAEDYDNFAYCEQRRPSCRQPLRYRLRELESALASSVLRTSKHPALGRTGTHRLVAFSAPVEPDSSWHAPTESQVLSAFELVVRRDDTYVGYLTELLGVPFVHFPKRIAGVGHQTDLRLGADCVALSIYGRRRMGDDIPYVAPRAISRFSDWLGDSDALDDVEVRAGDVLNFGFQVAVLYKDTEPFNRLDGTDLIIHTFHESARIDQLDHLAYRHMPFSVRRWRVARGARDE